jgi:hypothetical protein
MRRPAGSGQLGVDLVRELTRAVERVKSVDPCREQPNLSAEGLARLLFQWGENVGLGCPEAPIELGEELGAAWGGDDPASSSISRIRAAFDQTRRLEVVEEVGHDGPVDAEVLSQSELTPNRALGRRRKDLVAPRTAGEVGYRLVGGLDVGPKDSAQAPSEVVRQSVVAAAGIPNFVSVTRDVVHDFIIRPRARSVVP